jgi:hypothetical protein
MANDEKPKCSCGDEITIGPAVADNVHVAVRHTADHEVQAGFVRKIREGESLPDNAFFTECIEGNRYKCTPVDHVGPTRVATPAYRDGWDRIFGGKQAVGQA